MNRDDELLSAYLDGALDPQGTVAFEKRLANEEALAARAASWRDNDRWVQGALGPVAQTAIPEDLLIAMGLAEADPRPVAANDNPRVWRRWSFPLGGALAASLALALVLGLPSRHQNEGLSLALDRTPSMQQARLADGRVIAPLLTLQAADGRWCREYRDGASLSLACRGDEGWMVEGSVTAGDRASGDEYALASGDRGEGLERLHRRLGTRQPLGAAEEAALIAGDWARR